MDVDVALNMHSTKFSGWCCVSLGFYVIAYHRTAQESNITNHKEHRSLFRIHSQSANCRINNEFDTHRISTCRQFANSITSIKLRLWRGTTIGTTTSNPSYRTESTKPQPKRHTHTWKWAKETLMFALLLAKHLDSPKKKMEIVPCLNRRSIATKCSCTMPLHAPRLLGIINGFKYFLQVVL